MREASLELTTSVSSSAASSTSPQVRRASDSPPMASRRASAHAHRTESKARLLSSSAPMKKKKSLAKILFPAHMSASEMVRRGRLGKFVSPKKVSWMQSHRTCPLESIPD